MSEIQNILFEIGFNNLEAEVYIYLLSHQPATAYRIGKQLNKPSANVYKAIYSLSVKGAVIIEDNKNKLCKAVNPDEFLGLFERTLLTKTKAAKEKLQVIKNNYEDQNSYLIESVPLVFERFKTMMDKCTTIAVIDAFPKTLGMVVNSIENAINRGIEIYIEAYNPIEIKGANTAIVKPAEKTLDHWKSQQLNLVIDGNEYLMALMSNDLQKVIHATWSNNTYMSCVMHAGRLHEYTVMKIMEASDKPNFESDARTILEKQKFFYNSNIPGFNKLFIKE